MAAHFYGRLRALHTSNAGKEMFLRGLLAFASRYSTRSGEEDAVVRFLQRCDYFACTRFRKS